MSGPFDSEEASHGKIAMFTAALLFQTKGLSSVVLGPKRVVLSVEINGGVRND